MRPLHVGFYVHYHGLGHKHRTEAILRYLTIPATVLTSRFDPQEWTGPTLQSVVTLPCDIDDVNSLGMKRSADVPSLHYAPLWTDTITDRVAMVAQWLSTTKPDLMVIDVSAEITMVTRLASIPSIVMRQHGDRRDKAHLSAYAAAHSLLAPFPLCMEEETTPDWVRSKTIHLAGFARPTTSNVPSPSNAQASESTQSDDSKIVVLFGRGGSQDVSDELCQAALAMPDHQWVVVGKEAPTSNISQPANLQFVGWVSQPEVHTSDAAVVITAAGHNSVMELGRAGCRFIAIAEPRPFDEQLHKVSVLNREKLAIGLTRWPDPQQWPNLIDQAKQIDTARWKAIFEDDGARQAAEHVLKVAIWSRQQREQGSKK